MPQGAQNQQLPAALLNEMAGLEDQGNAHAIVEGMRAHSQDAGVQEKVCEALMSLAFNAENKVAIAEAGGITAVIAALQLHSTHAKVQENDCTALYNLAMDSAENKVAIAEADGISAVVAALQQHPTHAFGKRMAV